LLREGGAPEEVIAEYIGLASDDFQVWHENWQALELFLMCGTQWRVIAGMGGTVHQGIDYQSLESVMRLTGIKSKKRPALFNDVRLLERGALEKVNDRGG